MHLMIICFISLLMQGCFFNQQPDVAPGSVIQSSTPPCPSPQVSMDTWRVYSVNIKEGTVTIRLPKGWKHTPLTLGLYPEGVGGGGPYWSTMWVHGTNDYFHLWVQPSGGSIMKNASLPVYTRAEEYSACSEIITGRDAFIETRAIFISIQSAPYQVREYCGAATIKLRSDLWLGVEGCLRTKRAQEEFIAALRTIEFKD
jgi:hypothetical protein